MGCQGHVNKHVFIHFYHTQSSFFFSFFFFIPLSFNTLFTLSINSVCGFSLNSELSVDDDTSNEIIDDDSIVKKYLEMEVNMSTGEDEGTSSPV